MKLSAGCKSAWRNKGKSAYLFLLPSFAGVCVFIIVPFIDVVRRSFLTAVSGKWKGIDNYQEVFANQAFLRAVRNTLRFTLTCLPVLIIAALLVSVVLWKSKWGQMIKSALLLPLAVPAAAVVFIWKMFFSSYGILNMLLVKSGQQPIEFMGTDASFWVLVVSYVWKNLGYTVVLFLAGLSAVSDEVLEAARMDGAGQRALFFHIIFPQLKPMLYTITVLSFLNSFKVFREAYLVAGAYPQEKMYLLQHLFNNWFTKLEMDKLAAAAVCVAVPIFIGILLLQHFWDREGER